MNPSPLHTPTSKRHSQPPVFLPVYSYLHSKHGQFIPLITPTKSWSLSNYTIHHTPTKPFAPSEIKYNSLCHNYLINYLLQPQLTMSTYLLTPAKPSNAFVVSQIVLITMEVMTSSRMTKPDFYKPNSTETTSTKPSLLPSLPTPSHLLVGTDAVTSAPLYSSPPTAYLIINPYAPILPPQSPQPPLLTLKLMELQKRLRKNSTLYVPHHGTTNLPLSSQQHLMPPQKPFSNKSPHGS